MSEALQEDVHEDAGDENYENYDEVNDDIYDEVFGKPLVQVEDQDDVVNEWKV